MGTGKGILQLVGWEWGEEGAEKSLCLQESGKTNRTFLDPGGGHNHLILSGHITRDTEPKRVNENNRTIQSLPYLKPKSLMNAQ